MRNVPVPVPWRILLASVAFQLGAAHAQSLTYLVGADASVCDFDRIQDAINAAQVHPGPDSVRIATNLDYTGLALKVGAQDLTIEGGYPTCADALVATAPPVGSNTVLSGLGAPADSVIEFTGHGARVLRGFIIRQGDDPVSGGGIQFNGTGQLLLEHMHVVNNISAHGGGINFHGAGGGLGRLIIGHETMVLSNLATESGGGIRVTGFTELLMHSRGSAVVGNDAEGLSSDQQGHGGGILVIGPARAGISSAGPGQLGAISQNSARYGGGLAVLAPDDDSTVLLYSAFADSALLIEGNRASVEGGGIYLGGDLDSFGSTRANVRADEIRIEGNQAPRGAAVAVKEMAAFGFNTWSDAGLPRPPAAATCAAGVACNSIESNWSATIDGSLANGPIVDVDRKGTGGSTALLHRVSLRNNVGGSLLDGEISASHCLMAGNSTQSGLANLAGSASLQPRIHACTVADNAIGGDYVFGGGFGTLLSLSSSIIEQPGKNVFPPGQNIGSVGNLLVSSCLLIDCDAHPNVVASVDGPRFVDPDGGNYRLHPASPAVDFAPPVAGDDRDLDGLPYDVDLVARPNLFGERDLGAYELQQIGNLVSNADFVDDFHPWQEVGTATFQETGAEGSPGGSVLISDGDQLALDEVVGLRQCVSLPGPGTYRLSGRAAGQGLISSTRDRVRLRWRYYAEAGSNDCTGASTQGGDVLFPNAASMSAPLQDIFIVAGAGEFNERTQVAIELVAIEGNTFAANDSTGGMFDAIRLIPDSDVIFADGFE